MIRETARLARQRCRGACFVNIWEQERGSFIYRVNYCFRVQLVARRVEKFVCSKHRRQPWRVGAKDVCDNRVAGVLFKCDEEASSNESPASLGLLAAFASTVHSWNIASCDKRLRSRSMRLCFERTCYTWKGSKVEKRKKGKRSRNSEEEGREEVEEKKKRRRKRIVRGMRPEWQLERLSLITDMSICVLERAVCFRVQWTYRQCNARASNFCSRSLLFVFHSFPSKESSWYWNSWKEILIKERIAIIGG